MFCERMPEVIKKALLQRYFGKKIRILKISKYVILAGYRHRATTGCATLKQGTTVLKNEVKNCAINNDEFFAGIINKQIVNHLKLNLLFLHYL